MTANVTDLSQLPPSAMSDVGLASHLAARYHQGMPFATISSRTLVMINTYTAMDEQRKEPLNAFSIQIFNRMVKRGESQLVLFLGESGSGKTEFKNNILFSLLSEYGRVTEEGEDWVSLKSSMESATTPRHQLT